MDLPCGSSCTFVLTYLSCQCVLISAHKAQMFWAERIVKIVCYPFGSGCWFMQWRGTLAIISVDNLAGAQGLCFDRLAFTITGLQTYTTWSASRLNTPCDAKCFAPSLDTLQRPLTWTTFPCFWPMYVVFYSELLWYLQVSKWATHWYPNQECAQSLKSQVCSCLKRANMQHAISFSDWGDPQAVGRISRG